MKTTKWVYLFDELDQAMANVGNDWDAVRGLFGGKGANLADMQRLGVPVPPGFTVTTEACNAYLEGGGVFPDDMWDQELRALLAIEKIPERFLETVKTPCWSPAGPVPSSPCPA